MTAATKVTLLLHRMDLVEKIKKSMEQIEIPGYIRNPKAKIGTSAVVDFALAIMAHLYLNPENMTINRHTFLEKVEKTGKRKYPDARKDVSTRATRLYRAYRCKPS